MSHVFITRRATPRVAAQSKVLPASWRLLEWSGSERRVVCTLLDTKSIRLSSAISHEQRLAEGVALVTRSGRVYELHDAPTVDTGVCKRLQTRSAIDRPGGRDVSDELWAGIDPARLRKVPKKDT